MEEADRKARDKERKEAEERARKNQELFEHRKLQALEKERRLQEQAKNDRDEFQRIIVQQKIERDIELKLDQDRKAMVKDHADQLKKQIALNEEKKKQDKRTLLEEGKKVKDKLASEQKTLEGLKSKKMAVLQATGVNEKYIGDLARKKIHVWVVWDILQQFSQNYIIQFVLKIIHKNQKINKKACILQYIEHDHLLSLTRA